MNRIALLGLVLLGAACDIPLVMLEVEAPEVCVTKVVDIDPSTTAFDGVSGVDELPADMGVKLSGEFGTDVSFENNLVDLPAEAEGLLDLDVQLKLVRIRPLPPHADALDGVDALSFTVNPPPGSGLSPKTILAMTSVPDSTTLPEPTPLEASGSALNLADYLYAGQLTFTYDVAGTFFVTEAWQAEVTTCIATSGKAEASYNDIRDNL
jgi:hypothetical protein